MLLLFKNFRYLLITLVYFILVFSLLCGANLHVLGPLSLRHISTVVLLDVAIFFRKRNRYKIGALPLYIGYLIVAFICGFLNGEYVNQFFWQSMYTYHVPCIAIALGLPALIKDNNHIKLFVMSLIGLYVLNSLLTYFQYYNENWAWAMAQRISSQAEEGLGKAEMYTESSENLLGYAIVAGAFGFVVTNGYFLASYLPVIAYRMNQKGWINMIIVSAFLVFAGIAIFFTQQRMAFLSLVLFVGFYVWYGMKSGWRIPLILIAVIFFSYYGLSNIEMGRLTTDTNNDTRMMIFDNFFDFLGRGYWLTGGNEAYMNLYKKSQHNSLLAAWVGGGIFLFIIFVILYFRLLRDNLRIVFELKRKRFQYPFTICFSVASLIFLLYSLTHSAGVQSGSPMFWIVYTMMCVSYNIEYKLECQNQKKYIS